VSELTKKTASKGLRTATASGSHYDIGKALGRQCKDQALRMQKHFRDGVRRNPDLDMARVMTHARKVLPAVRDYYPEFVEEVEGYSEGTGIPFTELVAMVCDFPGQGKKGCTDIAVSSDWTKDDCVYAAHNEDVEPHNISDIALVKVKPKDEPGFVAVSYGGILPTVGVNAAGISLTGNAVVPNDTRPGIPKMIAPRKVLREKDIISAIRASMPEGRGTSFNNIVCDSNGEIYSMEGSATTFDALYATEGYLVHTNHYLSPRMWRFEEDMHTRFCSIVRYNRASRLFKKELGNVDVSTFKKILSDHVGHPESICRHEDAALREEDRCVSICSVVFDLTNRAAWVCYGNPCQGSYERHEL